MSTGVEEEEQVKKEKESHSGEKRVSNHDGEEWHEFEDESQRDYSDLKIQNFQIRYCSLSFVPSCTVIDSETTINYRKGVAT